ncbi:MAG: phosphotransferase family protein [Pseudomonadales bacterium]|nr:phosphotransferase family protein [Pseudomonadales bacterium]
MSDSVLDQAQKVREGEELDANNVDGWLKSHVEGLQGTPHIKQFPGGSSNLTYLVAYENRDLILRRPPFGTKAKSAHDMGREYRVMNGLKPVYPYVPNVVAFCDDEAVMGCDFYAMDRIKGIIPRKDMPEDIRFTEEETNALCRAYFDRFIDLHKIDYKAAGLESLGKGEGYVDRQIDGWNKRFMNAKTDDVDPCEKVMAWLDANRQEQVGICVVHGDYRLDNVVLDPENPTQLVGVLDWEMATLGDPLMDFGNTLCYWIEANDPPPMQMMRMQPSHLPGMMSRSEVFDYYCNAMGFKDVNFTFYRVYGIFRLAVILQQIYYRFYHGQTKDKRFAVYGQMVNALNQLCLQEIANQQ